MAQPESMFNKMKAELDVTFENWIPEVGEVMVGVIDSIATETHQYGPATAVRFIDEAGVGHTFRAFAQVAAAKMDEIKIKAKAGDLIGIKRLPDLVSKGTTNPEGKDKTYSNWNIRLEPADGSSPIQALDPEWETILANPEVDPADVIEALADEA